MDEYYIIEEKGFGEIIEKKSRFIAQVFPIKTETEATDIIEKTKKEYWDARHNCFAYTLGKNNEIMRFSDDGEPQGTAGKPILEVLTNNNLHNTLIIVTRYFGGTLLGTGGLVRAYGQSAKAGVENALVMKVCDGISFVLKCDYNSIGKIKYIMSSLHIEAVEEYGAEVVLNINMKKSDFETFKSQVTDATNGKSVFTDIKDVEYKQKM